MITPPIHARPLTRREKYLRMGGLSLVTSPLLGAYWFNHSQGSSPLFCPILEFTGIPCPGCGMTRSFLALAQGDLEGAIAFHLFGPLVFAACAGFALHIAIELYTQQEIRYPGLNQWLRKKRVPLLTFLVVILYHGARLWALAQSGDLAITMANAPLQQWLDHFSTP
ncbi:DUF2752 domain-containing protein [Spirulina sp. CCNP1310]|uniref:DUF2752 domain-containing protein n=1 Tax=Spirulina sp. CCNP1310 TaxID=3110249 RepID=UPI002B213287|nr:DUF2752 domain-containing protein [Spirulina sp. CCNP1310]MEA5420936.1 DUF2752 domain-containing protein [Spirulina sp. CCNP1310]